MANGRTNPLEARSSEHQAAHLHTHGRQRAHQLGIVPREPAGLLGRPCHPELERPHGTLAPVRQADRAGPYPQHQDVNAGRATSEDLGTGGAGLTPRRRRLSRPLGQYDTSSRQ